MMSFRFENKKRSLYRSAIFKKLFSLIFVRVSQVFYLDSMDYGDLSPSADIRPRIHLYDGILISKLIMSDTVGLTGATPRRVFGAGKVA